MSKYLVQNLVNFPVDIGGPHLQPRNWRIFDEVTQKMRDMQQLGWLQIDTVSVDDVQSQDYAIADSAEPVDSMLVVQGNALKVLPMSKAPLSDESVALRAQVLALAGRVNSMQAQINSNSPSLPTVGTVSLSSSSPAVDATVTITAPSLSGGSPNNNVTNEYYEVVIAGVVVQTITKTGSTNTFTALTAWASQPGIVRYRASHAAGALSKDSAIFTVGAAPSLVINTQNLPLTLTVGVPLSTQFPGTTGPQLASISGQSGTPAFAISPSLAAYGLSYDTTSSRLTGTPTVELAQTQITQTVTDNVTSAQALGSITIVPAPPVSIPLFIDYDGENSFSAQQRAVVQSCGGLNLYTDTELGPYGGYDTFVGQANPSGAQNVAIDGSYGRMSRVTIGGKQYLRLAVAQADGDTAGAGAKRTDINFSEQGLHYNGDILWVAINWRCPAAIWNRAAGSGTGNFALLYDLHASGSGGQIQLALRSWEGAGRKLQLQVGAALADISLGSYITPDTDHKIVLQIKIDNIGTAGRVTLWIDGTQRADYNGKTHDTSGEYYYHKLACYNGTATIPTSPEQAYWWWYRHFVVVKDQTSQYTEAQIRALLHT